LPTTMVSELKARYEEDGFVIVQGLLSPDQLTTLREAAERVIDKTRAGQWPHRRVVGKQFPPFGESNPDSWGVQHVMHPDLKEKAFAEWYCSDKVVEIVTDLLQCEEKDLQMELFNLLINPLGHEFALRWHRDDIRENATEEEEREALGKWKYGVQWNSALYEDSCLYVVPGSHKVPRTPAQRDLSSTPDPPKDPLDMPGVLQVVLKPGDTVFYNQNILHCATYNHRQKRATLHPCVGDTRGGATRARNILQHGLNWMKEERFADTLSPRGRKMWQNLIEMERDVKGDVGYSLDG